MSNSTSQTMSYQELSDQDLEMVTGGTGGSNVAFKVDVKGATASAVAAGQAQAGQFHIADVNLIIKTFAFKNQFVGVSFGLATGVAIEA